LDVARASGLVSDVDYTNEYVDAVEKLVDLQLIRAADLRVALDPMHGTGQVTLEIILTEARCRVTTIHGRHDPLFGGRNPAPDPAELTTLINTVREGKYALGLAMDGDADRIAIVDEQGRYITTNELLLLLYFYLHEVRGERGGVTRNLATTHLLDRLAAHFGEPCYEVPVGFKHIGASMKANNVLLAGESSGGLSIRGHILGKDGIFACALVVEMMARTRRSISAMLADIRQQIGWLVSRELNLPATPEMKILLQQRLAKANVQSIAGVPVIRLATGDGIKFYFPHDNWLLLRFSGTEPLLRIFCEADSEELAAAFVEWAQGLVNV
jgi:phosphomannomutase